MKPQSRAIIDQKWSAAYGYSSEELKAKKHLVVLHTGKLANYPGILLISHQDLKVILTPKLLYRDSLTISELPQLIPSHRYFHTISFYADTSCFKRIDSENIRLLTAQQTDFLKSFSIDLKKQGLDQDAHRWRTPLEEDTTYFGTLEEEQLVSVCYMKNVSNKICSIIDVLTLPSHRHQGFGSKLVSFATEQALEQGFVVEYAVESDNAASVKIPEKLGFESRYVCQTWYPK